MDRERNNQNKEEIAGSERGMRGVDLTYSTPGFKGRTFVTSGFSTEGTLLSASAGPRCGLRLKQVAWCQWPDVVK